MCFLWGVQAFFQLFFGLLMSEDFTNVLVRMSTELKASLQREAFVHHRKLTQEINMRLQASLDQETGPSPTGEPDSPPLPPFPPRLHPCARANTPTVLPTNDNGPAGALSDTDQAILEVFRALSVEKRLALLALLR